MRFLVIIGSMAMVALMVSMAFSQGGFKDVLDTPAQKSSLASKSLLNGITRAGKRVVSVGQRGHIVYSDDDGKNWIQASVPVSSDLLSVHFPSPLKGWVVGHDGVVLNSIDGGATWTKQFDGFAAAKLLGKYYTEHSGIVDTVMQDTFKRYAAEGADKPFLDVWFENESTGFIVGAFGLIFHTSDGGQNWEPWLSKVENSQFLHLYSIRPIGQDVFISSEQGLLFKSDGKAVDRFRVVKTPYNGTLFGVVGNSRVVIAFGMRGNIFRSLDRGGNWQKIATEEQTAILGGNVMSDGRIVLVTQGGNVLLSSDDGATFTPVKHDKNVSYNAVVDIDKNLLALAGLSGVNIQQIK